VFLVAVLSTFAWPRSFNLHLAVIEIRHLCEVPHTRFSPALVSFDRHAIPTDGKIAMMNELQIFAYATSADTFIYLSAIFALAYAAWAVWLVGRAPSQQALQTSIVRRAL
jgi:hypothetical protein